MKRGAASIAVTALILVGVAGCGEDSPEGDADDSGATELTRFLPADADGYTSADVAAIKRGLGLPPETSVMGSSSDAGVALAGFTNASLSGLLMSNPAKDVLNALDLPAVTAVASSSAGGEEVASALATSADTEIIRSRLLALGFVDHGGVLEGPDGRRATGTDGVMGKVEVVEAGEEGNLDEAFPFPDRPVAVRIDEGRFLVSGDAAVLRSLSTTPGEPPLEIQKLLEGDAMIASRGGACVESSGVVTSMDGSGRLVFMLSEEPDPARFRPRSAEELGAPEVEGSALIVAIERESPVPPRDIQAELLPGYDCEG